MERLDTGSVVTRLNAGVVLEWQAKVMAWHGMAWIGVGLDGMERDWGGC